MPDPANQSLNLAVDEMAQVQPVIDAVCRELGVSANDTVRARAIADRVVNAFRGGRHLPLNMVDAGLAERCHPSP
jgi:hypothetical protein